MTEEPIFEILPLVQMKEDGSPIQIPAIRDLCSRGLDKGPPEDRLLAWVVLSGVLSLSPETWADQRAEMVTQYSEFCQTFGVESYESQMFENSTSVFDFGVANNKMMELIHCDIIRTGHHIGRFPCPDSIVSDDPDDVLYPYHFHMRRLERLLYIFGICNGTISYMQGFNEIAAVLYFVYSQALIFFNNDWYELEIFVFYTFQRMMSATRLNELFTVQDQSSIIMGLMKEFMELLKNHLPKAHSIIVKHRIHPLHFCYRKLNLCFAQDHDIPGLILLWDALFAHFDHFVEFENYLMVANIRMVEELLDEEDYSQTLIALQKLKVCDARMMLGYADQFWKVDHPN
jgi:hypothetical protein